MRGFLTFVMNMTVLGFLFLLGTQNHTVMAQRYAFRLDLLDLHIRFDPVRLDAFLLMCIAAGYLWASVFSMPRRFTRLLQFRRLRKRVAELEEQLEASHVVAHGHGDRPAS